MKVIKIIITITAITMALTLILHTKNSPEEASQPSKPPSLERKPATAAAKRLGRFLEQNGRRNPRAADHCNKDNEICGSILNGKNATCCNNKCVDLGYNSDNCGACKNKCAFTEACCRGECVDLAYDKRHCGRCNNRCMPGGYCIYGLCDYA